MVTFSTKNKNRAEWREHVIKRTAQIFCGTQYQRGPIKDNRDIFQKENGTWVLSGGNNWFLWEESSDKNFIHWKLDYRYMSNEYQERVQGMIPFIEYELKDK